MMVIAMEMNMTNRRKLPIGGVKTFSVLRKEYERNIIEWQIGVELS